MGTLFSNPQHLNISPKKEHAVVYKIINGNI